MALFGVHVKGGSGSDVGSWGAIAPGFCFLLNKCLGPKVGCRTRGEVGKAKFRELKIRQNAMMRRNDCIFLLSHYFLMDGCTY